MPMPTNEEQRQYEEARRPELERKTKAELISLIFSMENENMRQRQRLTDRLDQTVKQWSDRVEQLTKMHQQETQQLRRELELARAESIAFAAGQDSALETVLARLTVHNGSPGAPGRMSLSDVFQAIGLHGGIDLGAP